jgi:hypothetical protein
VLLFALSASEPFYQRAINEERGKEVCAEAAGCAGLWACGAWGKRWFPKMGRRIFRGGTFGWSSGSILLMIRRRDIKRLAVGLTWPSSVRVRDSVVQGQFSPGWIPGHLFPGLFKAGELRDIILLAQECSALSAEDQRAAAVACWYSS